MRISKRCSERRLRRSAARGPEHALPREPVPDREKPGSIAEVAGVRSVESMLWGLKSRRRKRGERGEGDRARRGRPRVGIVYKSRREVGLIREAGRIVAEVLAEMGRRVAPGVTTAELRDCADEIIGRRGGESVFDRDAGFPASICTSVNEGVVHGVPGRRKLKEGDIVSVDVGVRLAGYIGDSAVTFPVGEVDDESDRLMRVTKECLERAVRAARPGSDLTEVSRAIQTHAEANGFSVVRDFVGHGVGEKLHEPPQVPNYVGKRGTTMKPGMVIAVEPMVNAGTWRVKKLADDWTVVTQDGRRSAHFEHTIAVSEDGAEVLTLL